jgi:hypothetical protein
MVELPADLGKAVNEQAEARVAMNIQGYAKYLTPEAVDTLRASFQGIPPRVNGYEITGTEETGGEYTVHVSYNSRADSFVVRSRWKQVDGNWKVVHAERLWAEGDKQPGPMERLAGKILGFFGGLRRGR